MISSYKLLMLSLRKVSLLNGCYNLNLGDDTLVSSYGDFSKLRHPFLCTCSMPYGFGMKELTCFGED